jgi:integrase
VAQKTGRQVILPLVRPLLAYVLALPAADDPQHPLFPSAHKTVSASGKVGTLSNRFYALLVSAGLAQARTHAATGKGRDGKRQQSEISFHALRHTATSLLKNAGVSDVVAREFIGHESAAVSKHYTHIETATLRQAGEKLPDIFTLSAGKGNNPGSTSR